LRRLGVVLGVVLCVGPVAVSEAAAVDGPFSAPVTLSATGVQLSPQVAVAADGATTVVWQRSNGTVQTSTRPAGGTFSPPVNLAAAHGDQLYDVAVAADGATIVWVRQQGRNGDVQGIVQASTRLADGTFSPPVNLSPKTQRNANTPQVAVAADGATTIVWAGWNGRDNVVQASTKLADRTFSTPVTLTAAGTGEEFLQIAIAADGATVVWAGTVGKNDKVQASTRLADGTFSTPVTLTNTAIGPRDPQVAVATDGTTTVVWEDFERGLKASTRPAGGTFSAPVTLTTAHQGELWDVAISADGATVLWVRPKGRSGDKQGLVQASTRLADGSFSTPVNLATVALSKVDPHPSATVAPDGTTTVMWAGWRGRTGLVEASTRLANGRFSKPVDLTTAGHTTFYPQVPVAADGTTTIVWTGWNGKTGLVQASTRRADGTFSPPIDLGATGRAVDFPQVAVAADGAVTAVWVRAIRVKNSTVQSSVMQAAFTAGSPTPPAPMPDTP